MVQADDEIPLPQLLAARGLTPAAIAALSVLWGKSPAKAGSRANLLLCHLLDTAMVAEWIWDEHLEPAERAMLDRIAAGDGRRLFQWLCAVHDCGKATPAFQSLWNAGAERVRLHGLDWDSRQLLGASWRHDKAGAKVLRTLLGTRRRSGLWSKEHADWVWPLVISHHGYCHGLDAFDCKEADGEAHGQGKPWRTAQEAVIAAVSVLLGYPDTTAVQPSAAPTKGEQLAIAGRIVMADWIASDKRYFPGIDDLQHASIGTARRRAANAWEKLGLHHSDDRDLSDPGADLFTRRFNQTARGLQQLVLDVAGNLPAPGLLIVEAPTGEGKTKAALGAAEAFARRFGTRGLLVAMPTQATCNPMYDIVTDWTRTFGGTEADRVVLLHGKNMFHPAWKKLLRKAGPDPAENFAGIDEDGCDEPQPAGDHTSPAAGPVLWFLGHKRGLLARIVVGTIDHVLFAATRTRHVMLRFAGLAGKVVIIDEVHAADVYMEQFLGEALRWLGQARVPVILLSATLTPRQRETLIRRYLDGAAGPDQARAVQTPHPTGYPSVTAAFADNSQTPTAQAITASCDPWRQPMQVDIEILPETAEALPGPTLTAYFDQHPPQGVILVIRNTVRRAQDTYSELRSRYGSEHVRLLHSRLSTGHRADRTAECLRRLGPKAADSRPDLLIVVATQIAEQSFDIDADLLITDLAPIDLLMQRIGRLHRFLSTRRHHSNSAPRAVITGFAPGPAGPHCDPGSEYIYQAHPLVRAAALVRDAAGPRRGWQIPHQVPDLVARGYADSASVPAGWETFAAAAADQWRARLAERAAKAAPHLLTRRDGRDVKTLEGLHHMHASRLDDDGMAGLVRDSDPEIEVLMVRRTARGLTTLSGISLNHGGEALEEAIDDILADTVRLPGNLTRSARALQPLDKATHPWLRYLPVLELDAENTARLRDGNGTHTITYDLDLGLRVVTH